jgi:ornithine cyclodeaminase/alanine dehydrogenase-like protein (mu-crystallin family)
MRLLTANDLRQALPMPAAIDAMAEAFIALSRGEVEMPLRSRLNTPGGVTLAMPAYAGGMSALKIVSVYGGNAARGLPAIHAVVMVLDGETGQPLALLDGSYLTALRTGAASGLATRLLSRPDSSVLGVIGAGGMAPAQIEAVCAVRDIRDIRVYSPRRAISFVEGLRGQYPQIRAVSSVAEALDGADIAVTSTDSAVPFVTMAHVAPGMHINAIGAYTPSMAEIAPEVVAAAKIVVDQREAAWTEAGDLIQARDAGLIAGVYAEIGEIAAGALPGRADAAEITLFKSVGVGAQDLFAARAALENASRLGLGVEVAF